MSKKKTFMIIVTLILIVFLGGCSNDQPSDQEDPEDGIGQITLRLGHNSANDSVTDRGAIRFAELVSEKSNGAMEVQVFPANQLGDNRSMIDQVSLGGLDMVIVGLGVYGHLDDMFMMMQIPFLFRSQEHIHKALDSEIGETLMNNMQKQGIYMLDMKWDRMPRQITSNIPLNTLEDMKDQIIRAGTAGPIEVFTRMGAKPTSVPLNEMYLATQQGVVDGVELPTDFVYDYSMYEVNSYINMLNHTYGTLGVGLSEITRKNLSEKQMEILVEAIAEVREYHNMLASEEENDYIEKLKAAGMTVVYPTDIDSFLNALRPMIPDLEKMWPGATGMAEKIFAIQ